MFGKSLSATGSRNSMNGMITNGRKGINRSRSVVVRRSFYVSYCHISQSTATHLTPLTPGQSPSIQHLPLQLRTDPDFLAEKLRPVPIVRGLLLNHRPGPGRKRPFGLVFLFDQFLLDLVCCDIGDFWGNSIEGQWWGRRWSSWRWEGGELLFGVQR